MSVQIKSGVLLKGWGRFDVMHLDRRVASVYEDGHCTVNFPRFCRTTFILKRATTLTTGLIT